MERRHTRGPRDRALRAASIHGVALSLGKPAVSQHLKVLKDVGLVFDTQEGTRRLYQVDPDGLALLRRHLDEFWERSLAAFEQRTRDERGTFDDRNH